MDADIGKLLFSFTIDESLSDKDFNRMGRAIRFRNSAKYMVYSMAALLIIFVLSMAVSYFFFIVFILVAAEILMYSEYSARSMGKNIKMSTPIHYDFYEDGLIETMDGQSKLLMYSKLGQVKMNNYLFTLVSKEDKEVVVIPKSLIDEDSEKLMIKLQSIIGRRR